MQGAMLRNRSRLYAGLCWALLLAYVNAECQTSKDAQDKVCKAIKNDVAEACGLVAASPEQLKYMDGEARTELKCCEVKERTSIKTGEVTRSCVTSSDFKLTFTTNYINKFSIGTGKHVKTFFPKDGCPGPNRFREWSNACKISNESKKNCHEMYQLTGDQLKIPTSNEDEVLTCCVFEEPNTCTVNKKLQVESEDDSSDAAEREEFEQALKKAEAQAKREREQRMEENRIRERELAEKEKAEKEAAERERAKVSTDTDRDSDVGEREKLEVVADDADSAAKTGASGKKSNGDVAERTPADDVVPANTKAKDSSAAAKDSSAAAKDSSAVAKGNGAAAKKSRDDDPAATSDVDRHTVPPTVQVSTEPPKRVVLKSFETPDVNSALYVKLYRKRNGQTVVEVANGAK